MPQSRWELEYEAVTAIPEADRLDRYSSDSGCWHYLFQLENFGCTNKTFISVLFLRLMTTIFVLCLYNFEFAKLRVKHCIERNLVYQHQTANPDFSSKSIVTNVICDECYCIRRSIHWLNILKTCDVVKICITVWWSLNRGWLRLLSEKFFHQIWFHLLELF